MVQDFNPVSSGNSTDDLDISFASDDARYSNDGDASNSEGQIDPNTNTSEASSVDFSLSGSGAATILLGGTVTSDGNETVNETFSGTITVSATYTNI